MAAELRAGDWRDVLPGTYDPARAVVVTDPPFGLNAPGPAGAASRSKHGPTFTKGFPDDVPWRDHVRDMLELLPAARYVVRTNQLGILDRLAPEPRRVMIELAAYRKRGMNRPGVVPYLWNAWAVYGRLRIGYRRRRPAIGDAMLIRPFVNDLRPPRRRQGVAGDGRAEDHGGMTPYASALWAVETWADDGWTVVDPYAGLGTIGQAAQALGFDYLGAEIDERYAREGAAALEVVAPFLGL